MRVGAREVAAPTLVLAVLAVTLVVAVGYGAATSDAAFGPHNPSWEGVTELRETATASGAEPTVLTDAERYRSVEANGTVTFVLDPGPRSTEERGALRAFVERGGTVVVATRDPEHGNGLLAGLETDVRVDGALLRDESEHSHGPAFPLVTTTGTHAAVDGVTELSLNHGTALVVGEAARPLANSSGFSYLDRDGDGQPGEAEALSARPVVAAQSVGDGEVVVASDPSVFINAMLEREPNRRFVANLVAGHDRVLLDRTDDGVPPLQAALAALRGWSLGPVLVGTLVVGIAVGWERGLLHRGIDRLRRRVGADGGGNREEASSGLDRAALSAYLAERHPEWDRDRRERVLGGVMEGRTERREHERAE